MEAPEEKKAEIIIVRRGGNDHDDEHHGGVWKIAYADFMTAMMAFFLVMWLVNVASEDAKQAVANYFNPIKLTDRKPQKPGMEDDTAATKEHVKKETQTEAANNRTVAAKNKNPTFDEEAKMLEEPYGALETIALLDRQDGYRQDNTGTNKAGEMPPAPMTAPRDPFAPKDWQAAPEIEIEIEENKTKSQPEAQPDETPQLVEESLTSPDAEKTDKETNGETDKEADKPETDPQIEQMAHIVAQDAQNLMQEVMQGRDLQEQPQMDIHVQDDGIVIELTDTQNYGMFAVGSAKPEAPIIDLLEGLAKIIDKYPGDVVISGYTDARPYKNTAHYDNWQLSAARAQMAHYMLVRGGLDESRILKVEAYADRRLRNSQDSYAAENRRIAIFLKKPVEENINNKQEKAGAS